MREHGTRVTLVRPAATTTEFAVGAGREADDPLARDCLEPGDVADAVVTTLRQPRRVRTAVWTPWSMGQSS